MKLSNLKNIKPEKITLKNADTLYADYLCALPQDKPKKRIWAAVGTVAAAVAIVAVVALWAIIGRGVRGTDADTPVIPANESVEITDEIQEQFNIMAHKTSLHALPQFKKGEIPAQSEIIDYLYYVSTPAKSDWIITAAELNDFAYDTFGVKTEFTSGTSYDGPYTVFSSTVASQLFSFTRSVLSDGTPVITLTYGEEDNYITTLSYVPISDFEPDYFIEHTTEYTVTLYKTDLPFVTEKAYKLSGNNAKQLLDLVRNHQTTVEDCTCAPTHKIVYSGMTYNIVMGDEFCSHVTFESGLGGIDKYTFTPDEYQKLSALLDGCMTDESFVELKKYTNGYTPSADTVTVTVNDELMPQKNGSYTIGGDDAKTLIEALEAIPYAEDTAKFLPSITLTVGERTYYLHTGNEPFVRSSCGQYSLDSDSAIIQLVQKYTDFGWNENGNGWYETDDGYYVTNDYGKTFEKYITRERAIKIANIEAQDSKYDYQPWRSIFYLDYKSKDASLSSEYTEGVWVDEWQTEHFSKGAPCWAVRLFDTTDPLTSLILYIDAKTGDIVGGATLSD